MVVIGAGYAGLPFAIAMGKSIHQNKKSNLRLTLVNPESHQDLTCEFYRTLRNGARSSLSFLGPLKSLGIDFKEARVVSIDPKNKKLTLSGARANTLNYDQLVIASGSQPQVPPIAGIQEILSAEQERVFVFKTQSQVQSLRLALRRLRWSEEEKFQRDRFVVVVGAGSTGIEVAGELAALRGKNPHARVLLVDQIPVLIPGESPVARRMLLSQLRKRNIEFILGSPVTRLDSAEMELQNGQMIPWDLLIICCGGNPNPPVIKNAFPEGLDPNHGLKTDGKLEISGSPDHFAIGDISRLVRSSKVELANDLSSTKSAQSALRSAKFLARSLAHRFHIEKGSSDESYSNSESGFLLSVGPNFGIARLGSLPRSNLGRSLSPFIWGPRANELKRLNEIRYRKMIQWGRWL